MNLTFRQSELFDPCRRHWALSYRRRLEPVRQRPSKAGIGTLVHKGLEHLYDTTLAMGPDAAMTALWEEGALTIQDRPEWVKEYGKQLVLARRMLQGYEQWLEETGADAGLTVTGVERTVAASWGSYEVPGIGVVNVTVTGKADLEVIDEWGMPRLIDHKTRDQIESRPTPFDPQRLTYGLLRYLEDGTLYAGGMHNVLRRVLRSGSAKPPFYGRTDEVHFSLPLLRKHHRHISARLQEMVPLAAMLEAGAIELDDPRLFPTINDCSWKCDFIEVCPLFDDGSDWEWALNEAFKPAGILEINDNEESN